MYLFFSFIPDYKRAERRRYSCFFWNFKHVLHAVFLFALQIISYRHWRTHRLCFIPYLIFVIYLRREKCVFASQHSLSAYSNETTNNNKKCAHFVGAFSSMRMMSASISRNSMSPLFPSASLFRYFSTFPCRLSSLFSSSSSSCIKMIHWTWCV